MSANTDPFARGARDAAQQQSAATNPYDPAVQIVAYEAWEAGAKQVHRHRAQGLDIGGHRAPPPHLCMSDVTKVCNCCASCSSVCQKESATPHAPAQETGLLTRAVWALVRIAAAMEARLLMTSGEQIPPMPCSTCGTLINVSKPCSICGAK